MQSSKRANLYAYVDVRGFLACFVEVNINIALLARTLNASVFVASMLALVLFAKLADDDYVSKKSTDSSYRENQR